MLAGTARYFDAILLRLNRKPVMTAMMVWSLVFGISVLIAGITVWRANSTCAILNVNPPNGAQRVTDVASRSDFLVHEAPPQAEPDMGISRKDSAAACPCAVSSKWHWQLI
jgi:hypothetical protein